MYPELVAPLLGLLGAATVATLLLLARAPVLRRLALRQVARRRTEALLVIGGSVLGTALIVSSFSVGDSLDASIRDVAGRVLGPVDERITTTSPTQGEEVARRLAALEDDPDVDGVLTVRHDVAASSSLVEGTRLAEPVTWVWEVDFDRAGRFGGGGSGLAGPAPAAGRVVVNDELADRLEVAAGDPVTFFLYGREVTVVVDRVVPHRGLAGLGLGGNVNPGAFFPPGALVDAASGSGAAPMTTTLVSNRGGVESGAARTEAVTARIEELLGGGPAAANLVVPAKQEVLDAAEEASAQMGALFLFIGSFSIIAGVLLLVNVFVMLAEGRKGQLGMLWALGLTRRRLVGEFAIEGALYAAVASALGLAVGAVVGRAVVAVAERIFNQWDTGGQALDLSFRLSATSVVNGFAAGFLIAFATVVLTSIRLSRLNVIAAIRDLPGRAGRGLPGRVVVASTIVAALLGGAAVPAVASSSGAAAYVLPSLALVALGPLLLHRWAPRAVWTSIAVATLAWALTANLFRPDVFDTPSMSVYIALGVLVTFSAVLALSENQALVLRPLRPLLDRPTEGALTARLGLAYPVARRFRTGATLVMYSIVVFVVVLLTQITAILGESVDDEVAEASAGWTHRVDVNPSTPLDGGGDALATGAFAGRVDEVAPLVLAPATASDPGQRRDEPLAALAVGLPDEVASTHVLALDERLPGLADDAAVWRAVLADARYVVLDAFFGATGGPPGDPFAPGDTFTLTDPATGAGEVKTIAGVLANGAAFYGVGAGEYRYPVLMGRAAVEPGFPGAQATSFLVATPREAPEALVTELQGAHLASGLVATSIRHRVEQDFAANRSFFRLMQGFLALGLLVGIAGLGVVMVRAVRERRRTIGVLRALGFPAASIRRAFMIESTFVAVEGTVLGAVLAVATTWLLYRNTAAFQGLGAPYPIAWRDIATVLGATLVASTLATVAPARRAAATRPAVAVRVAD